MKARRTGGAAQSSSGASAADGDRNHGAAGSPEGGAAVTGLVMVLACAAEFMVVLDASVVNVALPAIQQALGFDAAALSWVINAYTLVFAGFLLLGGRLTDLRGPRMTFLGGLGLFVIASVAGGLAVSSGMLVAARAVQALGAAMLAPASLAVLTITFPEGPRRIQAMATWTALASAGGAAGSLLGGVLTQYLTWRATLLINLPIGALAVLGALRAFPAGQDRTDRARLDLPGALTATTGTAALTYAITSGPDRGWSDPLTLGALAFAAAVLAVFVGLEARWSPSPLLPLRMLRLRSITVGNIAMLLAGACLMPMWFFLSLYMQHGLGLSPLLAGLGFLPHTVITVIVGARAAPWLMNRFAARTIVIVGCLLAAGGFLWQAQITPADTYLSGVLGPAAVLSVGGGLLNTPLTTSVTSGIDDTEAGAASGLMNTTKQLGGALGLAGLVALAATLTSSNTSVDPAAVIGSTAAAFNAMAALLVVVAATAALLPRTRSSVKAAG